MAMTKTSKAPPPLPSMGAPAARPLLKWAGGKGQLLKELHARFPKKFEKYIEPFFGGGAVFFSLRPTSSVIADINPELINLYRQVAGNLNAVISALEIYQNTREDFYAARSQDWEKLPAFQAAARTIYLNKTCFNGLYRVNKRGGFNVPFGSYKNPKIIDESNLIAASRALQCASIIHGDYKSVLKEYARPGDLIFLDPPYLPVSKYADFKRYTKEQFYDEDHVELAAEVERLHELGCHVVLTNSNHPLNNELYSSFQRVVVPTRRHISSDRSTRVGEDVIVDIPPRRRFNLRSIATPSPQTLLFPSTRYMGSKSKLLDRIWGVASQFEFQTALDLFSGSGVVSYMLKAQGKRVFSNDYMAMPAVFSKAMIENSSTKISEVAARQLLLPSRRSDGFVENTFQGLYFSDAENRLIDHVRGNLGELADETEQAIAKAALIRACLKKRARGIFTYTGHRYDDGRKDLQITLEEHFLEGIRAINAAVFDNGHANLARFGDAMTCPQIQGGLVYMDPPYYSPLSDNEYVRRYHFVEGIARDWKGVCIQEHTQTKKFKSYPTPFSSRSGAADAFDKLFAKYRDNILVVSYSSNSQPTMEEMIELIAKHKRHVDVVPVEHQYSFGTQPHKKGNENNTVHEYLFVGY